MASLVEVDEGNFETEVSKSPRPALADFSAEWCPPCKALAPVLEEIAKEYEGRAVVAHIDVDRAPNLARKYDIRSVPTLLFFKNGQETKRIVGLIPKGQLKEVFDEMLS